MQPEEPVVARYGPTKTATLTMRQRVPQAARLPGRAHHRRRRRLPPAGLADAHAQRDGARPRVAAAELRERAPAQLLAHRREPEGT